MIQELVARSLGIRLGEYHHFATSLHLYKRDLEHIDHYLGEGFQNPTFAMPQMPSGCQLANLARFLAVESQIRSGDICRAEEIKLPNYWRDLAIVLLRRADTRLNRGEDHRENNFSSISNDFYRNFFLRRPKTVSASGVDDTYQERLDLGDNDAGEN